MSSSPAPWRCRWEARLSGWWTSSASPTCDRLRVEEKRIMSCPFAGLATRYTMRDERVSVRICGAVPYERDSDPEDLPLPSVCFSHAAWESCAHYLRLTQCREVARRMGLPLR